VRCAHRLGHGEGSGRGIGNTSVDTARIGVLPAGSTAVAPPGRQRPEGRRTCNLPRFLHQASAGGDAVAVSLSTIPARPAQACDRALEYRNLSDDEERLALAMRQ